MLEIVVSHHRNARRAFIRCVFRTPYVLHVFQKKSTKGIATPPRVIDLINQRLADAEHDYREKQNYINVPAAGCSRFWIELVFGKAMFPKIEGSLDLLHPSVVAASNKAFGVNFAQGCWWG